MALRTALVIDGDTSGGQKALSDLDASMGAVEDEAAELADAYRRADAAIADLARNQAIATQEIAQAKQAYNAGEISLEEYKRSVLQTKSALELYSSEHRAAMNDMKKAATASSAANENMGKVAGGAKLAGHQIQNLTYQLNDMVVGLASGQAPMTVLMQQGIQIGQIMAQAGVGIGGLIREIGAMALGNPIILAVAGAALALGAAVGVVTAEINKNSAVHVTWKDTLLGTYDTVRQALEGKLAGAFAAMGITSAEAWDTVMSGAKAVMNFLIATAVAGPRTLIAGFQTLGPALGDAFYSAANMALRGINGLIQKAVGGLNLFFDQVRPLLERFGLSVPRMVAPSIPELENRFAGAGQKAMAAMGTAMIRSFSQDYVGDIAGAIGENAQARARAREAGEKAGKEAGAGAKRAAAAAGKEAADEFAKMFEKSLAEAVKNIDAFKPRELIDVQGFLRDLAAPSEEETRKLREFAEALADLQATSSGIDLAGVFGRGGEAIAGLTDAIERMTAAQEAYGEALWRAGQLQGDKRAAAERKAEVAYSDAKLANTVAMLGATKKLFAEQSTGYKMVETAEKAASAMALVNTVKYVAAGAAKMFASLGPFGFAAVAAMMAVMAGLGFSGGGAASYTPPSPEEMQAGTGTGTVLGDSGAQSQSLSQALEILASNSNADLEYSNEMVRYLRAISEGIGALTSQIARQFVVAGGGAFGAGSANLGTTGSSGFLGLFASNTTRQIYDQGIDVAMSSIGQALRDGVTAQSYAIIEQIKKSSGFLGIGGGTKTTYETMTGALNAQVTSQFAAVLGDVANSVVAFVTELGKQAGSQVVESQIRAVVNSIPFGGDRLSFEGMNGEEIQAALQAYFSAIADRISQFAAAEVGVSLEELQRAGEGLFETLARVTRTIMTVNTSLASIGVGAIKSVNGNYGLGAVTESMDALVARFGGLDEFQGQIADFSDKFLTEAERMQPIIAAVSAEMARLGQSGITTNGQFKDLVQGLDLSTDAGQAMFVQLMAVAPAFAKVNEYLAKTGQVAAETGQTLKQMEAVLKERRGLEIQLMEANGNAAAALAARRADTLAAMDASNRNLQEQVWAALDAADAQRALAAAEAEVAAAAETLAKTRRGLEIQLMEATGDAAGALAARRADEIAAMDQSLRGMLLQIHAAEDLAAANRAAAAEQAEAARIASQRQSIEVRILQLLGDTAALRERELAALDPSNRALQEHVYALEDAAAAAEASSRAQADAARAAEQAAAEAARAAEQAAAEAMRIAQEAAQAAQRVAEERYSLETRYLQATGDSVGALAMKRAAELAATAESNRALLQMIWAAEDAAVAVGGVSNSFDALRERADLTIRLLEAQGRAEEALAARRAQELAAADASNRDLLTQIYAAEDAAKASAALARAQDEQARAANDAAAEMARLAEEAAQKAADIETRRAQLQIDLMNAQGDSIGALALQRQAELAALDPSLRALQQQVWAAQAAAEAQAALAQAQQEAADSAEALRKAGVDLQIRYFEAAGDTGAALALRRQEEIAATDASLRGLLLQIYALEDAKAAQDAYNASIADHDSAIAKARDVLATAYERESSALADTISKFGEFAAGLRKFREGLFLADQGSALAYRQAQVKFLTTSALAAAGDASALGGLQDISTMFLAASRSQAGSAVQYQRDVSAVARAVDAAIGAADDAVDYAALQLEALDRSVEGLIEIREEVTSVRDAILDLEELLAAGLAGAPAAIEAPAFSPVSLPQGSGNQMTEASGLTTEMRSMRSDINAALLAIKQDTGSMRRLGESIDAVGSIRVSNDTDEPLTVEVLP